MHTFSPAGWAAVPVGRFGGRRWISVSSLHGIYICLGLYLGHLQSNQVFHVVRVDWLCKDTATMWAQVSPWLDGAGQLAHVHREAPRRDMMFQDLLSGIPACTWNSMKSSSQTTRSRVEYDALEHAGRGLPACTPASDEAKARMETKAAVEMEYMVKQTLGQRGCCSNGGEQPFILYPREVRVVRRMDRRLLEELTHVGSTQKNTQQGLFPL